MLGPGGNATPAKAEIVPTSEPSSSVIGKDGHQAKFANQSPFLEVLKTTNSMS